MSGNRRILSLNQLLPSEFSDDDVLVITDVDTGAGTPETKYSTLGDFTDYMIDTFNVITSGSTLEISSSLVIISSSVSSINNKTGSFATTSSVNGKLDNSLTGSYVAYGIPVLNSSGSIYTDFLQNMVFSFNGRQGDVFPNNTDYSSSMIIHISSPEVPENNVYDALQYLGVNKLSLSGGTMTGPIVLSGSPVSGSEAASKDYVDLHVLKSGDTMTGPLILPGIQVASNLIYLNPGTASVGIGTSSPTESAKLHVAGRMYVDEIQFSSDDSIQTSAGGAGGVTSFNARTGTISSELSDYAGFYVDSFNGRSGSVSAQSGDYDGYYVSTSGSSIISFDGEIIFDNNGLVSFEDNVGTDREHASLNFQRDDISGSVIYTDIYQNASSSQNPIITDGDFALIFKSSLSGSETPEYDFGSPSVIIGPYSTGSTGLKISRFETKNFGKFVSEPFSEFNGWTNMNGTVTASGEMLVDGVLRSDGFFTASVGDIASSFTVGENIYVYGTGGVYAQSGSLYTKNIFLTSPDGVDLDYGKIYVSEIYVSQRSEDSSGGLIQAIDLNTTGVTNHYGVTNTYAPLTTYAGIDSKDNVTVSGSLYVSQSVVYPDTTVQTTAFSPYSTSSTYTVDTPITASHGLGRHPFMIQAKLRCVSTDGLFDVGDEVPVLPTSSSLYTTDSNIYFLPRIPLIKDKDGLADASITDSNWIVVLTAI